VRSTWKDLFNVQTALDYLDGKQMPPGWKKEEWITINMIYSHLKAQLPSLYSMDPYFYVKLSRTYKPFDAAEVAKLEAMAKGRQAMLNYIKKEIKLKDKVRLAIQDSLFSYGVAKVHYYAELKENPDKDLAVTGDDGELLYDDDSMPIKEPDYIPVNERYCVTRVHPDDFLWDEDAGPLPDDWRWLAQRIREPWEKAEKNPRYDKKALRAYKTKLAEESGEEEKERETRKKGSIGSGDIKGRSERTGKPGKKDEKTPDTLIAWEIYDLEAGQYLTIAEGGEIPLVSPSDLPKGVEKHPFAVLRMTLRDDSPYPIPPMSQGIDPQREFNMARSDIVKHRKRFNRKYEANVNAMVDAERDMTKIETGDDGTVIPVMQLGTIAPIQDAPMDQGRYLEINYLRQDMIEVLGGSADEARGIAGAESATQAGILDKRLEMKEGDALSMVVDFVTEIAAKMDQLVAANITKEEAVKVQGPQGEYWVDIRPELYEDIEGQYIYEVNAGATMPRLPQMERTSWMAFLSFLGNNPQFMGSRRLMEKAAEMHHIEDDALIDELMAIGERMMSGQIPTPGQSGSLPNVAESRPVSAMGGQAGGAKSLDLPGAGNLQG
jgi:hypothetical protein